MQQLTMTEINAKLSRVYSSLISIN